MHCILNKAALCMGLELDLQVHNGDLPYGAMTISSNQGQLDIEMETAAGHPSSYPGNDCALKYAYK